MTDDELQALARDARLKYRKGWRDKNADKVREYKRKWSAKNRDKVRKYTDRYWLKKAGVTDDVIGSVTDNHTDNKLINKSVTDNVTDNKVSVTDNVTDNVCIVCGQVIQSKRIGAVYCSPSCKQKHYRQKKK